jgi:putative Mg2+ transporter-C (MgtC) family protein
VLGAKGQIGLRLGVALIAGGLLGLNRELHGKPAGFRTHALVSLGAAAAALAALNSPGGIAADVNAVGRVAQGILTGVGFLGAGVILRDPSGHVSGLTTAATIWICAVIGFVCALGYWVILGTMFGLTAFALVFGGPLERLTDRLFARRQSAPDARRSPPVDQ